MKIKVRYPELGVKEVDIDLPIYSHISDDGAEVFVKIDENSFNRIEFGRIVVELYRSEKILPIHNVWINNPCTKEEYYKGVEKLKEYISNF